MKFAVLIGTRPGIIKMSALYHELDSRGLDVVLIHSGQHFSDDMDKEIMKDVNLPVPDYHFVRPADCVSHAEQTAFMLVNIEKALMDAKPNLFFVCGDANTNMAGALAARKLHVPVAHVEAGLRSRDWRMPEEHNRVIIDHISELLFAPTDEMVDNLKRESVNGEIYCVGNTVADSALRYSNRESINKTDEVLLTLHREENVDEFKILQRILEDVGKMADMADVSVNFLVHPRTKKMLTQFDMWGELPSRIKPRSTIGYREMLTAIVRSKFVLTDSGGLQEESCILGTPCYTLRQTTERPETEECGSNVVIGTDTPFENFSKNWPFPNASWDSPYGEGDASSKIVEYSVNWLKSSS